MQALLELARHSVGRCAHAAVLVDSGGGGDGAPSTVPLRCVASTATAGAGSMMDMVPFLHAGAGMEVELQRALESECDEPLVVLDAAALTGASNASLDYRFVTAVRCCRREDSVAAVAGILCVFDNMPRSASPPEADLDALRLVAGLLAGLVPDALATTSAAEPKVPMSTAEKAAASTDAMPTAAPDANVGPRADASTAGGTSASSFAATAEDTDLTATAAAYANLVVSATAEMISVHDTSPEGTYLYASPASKELLGWEPEELVGKPVNTLFHPDEIAPNREILGDILDDVEKEKPVSRGGDSVRLRKKDGSYLWVHISTKCVKNQLVCVTRDDSYRHQVHIRCISATRAESCACVLTPHLDSLPCCCFDFDLARPVLSICSSRFNCAKTLRSTSCSPSTALISSRCTPPRAASSSSTHQPPRACCWATRNLS